MKKIIVITIIVAIIQVAFTASSTSEKLENIVSERTEILNNI